MILRVGTVLHPTTVGPRGLFTFWISLPMVGFL